MRKSNNNSASRRPFKKNFQAYFVLSLFYVDFRVGSEHRFAASSSVYKIRCHILWSILVYSTWPETED